MSHVQEREAEKAELQIRDLTAAAIAGTRCGLGLMKEQNKFRYYGSSTHPCVQAFAVPGIGQEIGLVNSQKFPGTYNLAWDNMYHQITEKIGPQGDKFLQLYHLEAAKRAHAEAGDIVSERYLKDVDEYELVADTTMRMGV